MGQANVAVLIPCFNEAGTIAEVVSAFARCVPGARIFVYDNASSDDSAALAAATGAQVRSVPQRGKGNVVRRMLADVDADAYVLVDGDATYAAEDAPGMLERLFTEQLDMVVARRVETGDGSYRTGHRLGNRMLTALAKWIFGRGFTDMLSGYRVLSRRYAKSFAAHAHGFETETELAIHALELDLPVAEVPSRYHPRPEGSSSKLHTLRDGWRIAAMILLLARNGRPLAFFSIASAASALLALALAWPLFTTYLTTGLVPRFPTAILCASLGVLSAVFLASGLILDTVAMLRREQKYLAYLAVSPEWRGQ